ncbi:MAG: TrmH family RNA methyltransferase [bacterium]|nr:TrmH family RNA methyltransferase [bacterium]
MNGKLELILHNIRSNYNVGSIFRTADGAGVKKIYLTGYTPAPVDEFKRVNSEIAKTALDAEQSVEWEKREDIVTLINELKKSGYQIWALEQNEKSVDYRKVKLPSEMSTLGVDISVVLILGNEVEGVESEVLNLCDQIIEIPMRGAKESLNVAVATGVAVFRLLD